MFWNPQGCGTAHAAELSKLRLRLSHRPWRILKSAQRRRRRVDAIACIWGWRLLTLNNTWARARIVLFCANVRRAGVRQTRCCLGEAKALFYRPVRAREADITDPVTRLRLLALVRAAAAMHRRAIVCDGCGGKFFPASLPFHLKVRAGRGAGERAEGDLASASASASWRATGTLERRGARVVRRGVSSRAS